MDDINEDELIIYEESKEIKETLWKIWDIINDKSIILKLLLNTSLVKDLKAARNVANKLLDSLENNKENKIEENKETNSPNSSQEDELTIHLEELQYENYLKTIIYIIDSVYIQKDKEKEKNSGSSKNNNSSLENSTSMKNCTDTISGEKKSDKGTKNNIKLILTERPITLDATKLLTVTMIDYSETLNETQLKNIVQYVFNNLQDSLREALPINTNSESIIINADINIVFFFFANWRTHLVGKEIVKDFKFNGDPKIPGSTIELTYLNKYRIKIIVEEVNSFNHKENEEDNNEWNYKYTIEGTKGQSESLNCIFVSCENGSKTLVTVENDINKNIGFEKLQELSERKLLILNGMKNYIENNLEDLKKLGNDVYQIVDIYK